MLHHLIVFQQLLELLAGAVVVVHTLLLAGARGACGGRDSLFDLGVCLAQCLDHAVLTSTGCTGNYILPDVEYCHHDVKRMRHEVDRHSRLEKPLEEHPSVYIVQIVPFRQHRDHFIAEDQRNDDSCNGDHHRIRNVTDHAENAAVHNVERIVGKIKEKFYRDAVAEYEKRLSRYCRFEVIEVADEKTPDHASENMELLIKEKEAERMEKYLKEGAYVIALAIEGKQLDSVELSQKIDTLGTSGISHIIFVIGGSLGLAERILKRADYKLSFSKMTFPHQLMRVILSEQIYRSYRIINHEPYHK